MRCPQISIALLMVIVAVFAVDFAVLQSASGGFGGCLVDQFTWMHEATIVSLPMLNILTIGLFLRRRRGRSRAFLLGFEVFGWLAIAGFALDYSGDRYYTFRYLRVIDPVSERLDRVLAWLGLGGYPWRSMHESLGWWVLRTVLGFSIIFLPTQLVPALVGGWLFSRERIRAAIGGRWLSESGAGGGVAGVAAGNPGPEAPGLPAATPATRPKAGLKGHP